MTQDYGKLLSSCLSNGELFCDPEFPAEDSSVFFSRSEKRNFKWLRPHVRLLFNQQLCVFVKMIYVV